MVSNKTINLFKIYANEYNKDSESELSYKTYDNFFENLLTEHGEETALEISDTLCMITGDNKIDSDENIAILKNEIIGGNIK